MPSPEPDPLELLQSLRLTREALESLQSRLLSRQTKRDLSVSDESRLRRTRRALKKLNHEYLPWARIGMLSPEQAAAIVFWLNVVWSELPLDEEDK